MDGAAISAAFPYEGEISVKRGNNAGYGNHSNLI